MSGGERNVTVSGGERNVTVSGGERNVTVSGGERNVTVSGGERNVTVSGGERNVTVHRPAQLPVDELAALLAVLTNVAAPTPAPPRRRERWGDPAQLLRAPLHPGPGAWTSCPPQG